MSSAGSIAGLILKSECVYAAQRYHEFKPQNFGIIIVQDGNIFHQLYLEEIGDSLGDFNLVLRVQLVKDYNLLTADDLNIIGPFGTVEISELFSVNEVKSEIGCRFSCIKLTSALGEINIMPDLDAVGSFKVVLP